MKGVADYHGTDEPNRNRHGLTTGDTIDAGMGPTLEVVDVDDEGVEFNDGSALPHVAVCANLEDLNEL